MGSSVADASRLEGSSPRLNAQHICPAIVARVASLINVLGLAIRPFRASGEQPKPMSAFLPLQNASQAWCGALRFCQQSPRA